MANKIEIKYCTKCRWLMRSAWMAQELLTTFDGDIHEVSLLPGTDGLFEIIANGHRIWSRKERGGFPEITELKQIVRDAIVPNKDLGCIDRKVTKKL
ncbi:SelT/SelW/SelH family protein [Psychromonas sp.]|nr:SelT/SelW/SelH family protein [Psychromonas sp.]